MTITERLRNLNEKPITTVEDEIPDIDASRLIIEQNAEHLRRRINEIGLDKATEEYDRVFNPKHIIKKK